MVYEAAAKKEAQIFMQLVGAHISALYYLSFRVATNVAYSKHLT